MSKGEFARITYEGKIKESGEVFDRGENIPIIIGEGFVIKGLDETLEKMKEGEEKTVEIPPEKAFGERSADLVKLVPLSEFRKNNMNPYPGMVIRADNLYGRVLSVSSGRVRVDFNHPLAGKKLEYKVKIEKIIKDEKEKVLALIEFFSGRKDAEAEIKENSAEIKVKGLPEAVKRKISEHAKKYLGLEKIIFVEEF